MPGRVNRVPRGLLSLLGLKSLGDNPNSLSDQITPTVDLTPWWFTYPPRNLFVVSGVAADGFFTAAVGQATVPTGQIWVVLGFNVIIDAAVGSSIPTRAAVAGPSMIYPFLTGSVQGIGVGTAPLSCGMETVTPASPLILTSGYQLGAWTQAGTYVGGDSIITVASILEFDA